ncbi:MAG: glycerophosphodiester phosphodiesterase family protein [Anaerolineales bacterium]
MRLDSWPRPCIFAHRGASAYAPENTLAAFELALQQGAPAIELDVKLSADGHVVVIHDPTVDRTTNGKGKVARLSLSELRALDAGSFFSEKYRGEKIPTLEEVFDLVGKRALINIELTNYTTPRDSLVEEVCRLVREHRMEENVLFSSFLPRNLHQAAILLPEVPRGLLALEGWKGLWMRSFQFFFGNYQALHPYVSDVTPQQIASVHRIGRRVHVWTVNDANQMRRLLKWGADGIFTDDPPLALQIAAEFRGAS